MNSQKETKMPSPPYSKNSLTYTSSARHRKSEKTQKTKKLPPRKIRRIKRKHPFLLKLNLDPPLNKRQQKSME
jgi:hypothetical protein